MASLGWLLNLDFAGSESAAAAAGPAVGSLLLLGVGRMWWLPLVWPFLTGQAYAGEVDYMVEYASSAIYFLAGALMTYGLVRIRAYLEARRKAKLPVKFVKDERLPHVVGFLGGPGRVCPICRANRDTLVVLSDKSVRCAYCAKG